MEQTLSSRIKSAWNVFRNRDPTVDFRYEGASSYYRPDRPRFSRGNERSIVTALYNRIALDVSAISIQHVSLDENGRYLSAVQSGLQNSLTVEANIDQTGRAFIQDVIMSMFDEGCVAIVPTDTSENPKYATEYDILSLRTGKIVEWFPAHIRIRIYNERTGRGEEILVPKKHAAIVENPLYAVINEPNSTMSRLIRKLNLLDAVDEQSSSGKLDLIIKLPYITKTDTRRQMAENRRAELERQLSGSKYGIAYIDGTENITQLNRPVENNLMKQIEYLTSMLYSQLGISQSILDGTADEKTNINYYSRTIEPCLSAITEEIRRKFLSEAARREGQSIMFIRDPFKLIPVSELANSADKFTRNEILTPNEVRQIIGQKPSEDPNADKLKNRNISDSKTTNSQENDTEEENSK